MKRLDAENLLGLLLLRQVEALLQSREVVLQRRLVPLEDTLSRSEGGDDGDGILGLARRVGEGSFALLVELDELSVGPADEER